MRTETQPMVECTDNKNASLHCAKSAKNDEFYTQMSDIEAELRYYREHFCGKVVFCNCDDPHESNFLKYFALNFNTLGLKKLIATCYAGTSIAYSASSLFDDESSEAKPARNPLKIEISEAIENPDIGSCTAEVAYLLKNNINELTRLKGDGDFRSPECIELLKRADVVVTNPPFSLFREFVSQLDEYGKKFLIVGNKNAITYKEIFKLIMENKMWVGNTPMGKDLLFDVPEDYAEELTTSKQEGSAYKIVNGVVKGRAQAIWFTNVDIKKRHEVLKLCKNYTPKDYPRYDNYDAIEVSKVSEIPMDYDGVMGVPISFLDKYNPDQFEIIGSADDKAFYPIIFGKYSGRITIQGRQPFKRLFIRRV
jgi:hypothetical protein